MHVRERLTCERRRPVLGPEELVLDEEAARLIYLKVLLDRAEGRQEQVLAAPSHLLHAL